MDEKAGRSFSCGKVMRCTWWISPGAAGRLTSPGSYGPASRVDLENTAKRFVAPERFNLWPQAHLHTQWPGKGEPGDPAFDQFYASQVPSIENFTLQQTLNRDAIVALLEKIGPAILLTHSQSGAFGWPVADARVDLVKAIIAVEPNGPPFFNVDNVPAPEWFRDAPVQARPWGITAVHLTYDPPVSNASELAIARQEKPDCRGPGTMLGAKIAGAPASEAPKDSDFDPDRRSVLSCALRSLHREVPGAGGCASHLDQAGRNRHSRQWSHDDAGEEQPGDRASNGEVVAENAAGRGTRAGK